MELDKSQKITDLTLLLVKKLAGENQSESQINQSLIFSMRIMGSTLTTETAMDDFHVSEMIKRKLMKDGNTQGALQFADLSRKLTAKRTLEKPWRLLYLLCKISDMPSSTANWLPTALPTIGDSSISKYSRSAGPQTSLRFSTPSPAPQTSSSSSSSSSVFLNSNTPNYNSNNNSLVTPNQNGYSYNYNFNAKSSGPSENTSFEIPEGILIRDVIYAFQAIDGKYIKYDPKLDLYAVDPTIGVSKPLRDQVTKVCELGWLYRRVKLYIEENAPKASLGLIHQSLCSALQQELTDYYRFIAVLETQINQLSPVPLSSSSSSPYSISGPSPALHPVTPSSSLSSASPNLIRSNSSSPSPYDNAPVSSRPMSANGANGAGSLTLRRLPVWVHGPLQKMKLMAVIVDGLKGLRGGAIISYVNGYSQNGDPAVQAFIKHLMTLMCAPFYKMVKHWVFEGELEDPYSEFFVASDPSVSLERVWHAKYTLRKEMIPSFVPLALANKILVIGKSINVIRQCCKDTTWVTDTRALSEDSKALSYGNLELFEGLIRNASTRSSKRLIEIMLEKFKFVDHCTAIKRYLLLGQGDFTQHLMDLIGTDLLQPAVQIYRHNLIGILDQAITQSNAQYDDEDVLKRLDIKLLEPPPGGTGWDVFSLDYHVDTPINSVFTPEVMSSYLHIFQFLWNIKRVEYALSATWRRQITSSHNLRVGTELQFELHKCNMIRNEMLHFVYHLQYYIMFEVLESYWSDFITRVKAAQDLDELISAHTMYLTQIITNTFLSSETQGLRTLLQRMFAVIIKFTRAQDAVYNSVDEEIQLQKARRESMAVKTSKGKWGVTQTQAEQEANIRASQQRQFSPELRNQVTNLSNEYHNLFTTFRDSLSAIRLSGDVNLKFLCFRLDFNEFYQRGTSAPISSAAIVYPPSSTSSSSSVPSTRKKL